jgi:hypothetical protein
MPATGPVIPLSHIKTAVSVLIAGLVNGQPVPADHWDRAVTTLARSHQQLGGTTRRLVYATIAAAHPDAHTSDLPRALTALGNSLDLAETMHKGVTEAQLRLF